MSRFIHLILITVLSLSVMTLGHAQGVAPITVTLKSGEVLPVQALAPQAGKLQLTFAGGAAAPAPRVLEPAAIERIDMPRPASLIEAADAFLAGDDTRTLSAMGKLRVDMGVYKTILGAKEWWIESEFLRAHILLYQKRVKDVETSMKELIATGGDPLVSKRANVFLAHLVGLNGDPRKAAEQIRIVIKDSNDQNLLADAWLLLGHNLLASNDQAGAVMAYLRLPIFFPDKDVPVAEARLGAARSFIALENTASAREILKELIAKTPKAHFAVAGKKLLATISTDDLNPEEESKTK
jgi:tetratricopeptide (TPR) repeat protein